MATFDVRYTTDGDTLTLVSITEVPAVPPTTIVFAGDSVTEGSLDLTTTPPIYIPEAETFASLVGSANGYTNTINAGKSGSNVASLKARFAADVLSHNPDVVVVMIGINDVTAVPSPTPVSAFKDDLLEIVDSIQAAGAIAILATPNLIRITQAGIDFPAYLDAIAEVGEDNGCQVIPVYDRFCRKYFSSTQAEWDALFYDDKHPSSAGHAFIASILSPAIPTGADILSS